MKGKVIIFRGKYLSQSAVRTVASSLLKNKEVDDYEALLITSLLVKEFGKE